MGYGDVLYLNTPGQGNQPTTTNNNFTFDPLPPGVSIGVAPDGPPTLGPDGYWSSGPAPVDPPWHGNPTPTTTYPTNNESAPAPVYYGPPAVPRNPWLTTSTYVAPTGVKQATPDIVVFDNSTVDLEFLTDTFFEEFGGQELIKISRSDLIDGKEVSYNPIKNLSRLNQQYNPNTVIAIAPFQQNLSAYAIDLVLRGINEPYIDRENGYLVVEIDNVKRDESIEIEIATDGTMNRIIYDY